MADYMYVKTEGDEPMQTRKQRPMLEKPASSKVFDLTIKNSESNSAYNRDFGEDVREAD